MNQKHFTVCGVVFIGQKVLLVRHTYGVAKDRLLLPGGYVKEHELPNDAVEREIFEETSIKAKAKSVMAMQFKPEQWCVVFLMQYVSGTPQSDQFENSEAVLLSIEEAIGRNDITNMSRTILTAIHNKTHVTLQQSDYCPSTTNLDLYRIFGV